VGSLRSWFLIASGSWRRPTVVWWLFLATLRHCATSTLPFHTVCRAPFPVLFLDDYITLWCDFSFRVFISLFPVLQHLFRIRAWVRNMIKGWLWVLYGCGRSFTRLKCLVRFMFSVLWYLHASCSALGIFEELWTASKVHETCSLARPLALGDVHETSWLARLVLFRVSVVRALCVQ
jgi:hypothetical protein